MPTATTEPTPTRRVETTPLPQAAEENKPARTLPGMPTKSPQVAPPVDEQSLKLTPASGVGSSRPVAAALVPTDPTLDKPDTTKDQESIREIRELLASDRQLAAISSQITIVARGGRVWLRGQVNTAEQRAAVEKQARRAGGVLDVKNELLVLE